MAGPTSTELPVPRLADPRVLIVEARFHGAINDMLLAGAGRVLQRAGARVDHVVVPGALEIPPVIAHTLRRGGADAYVALGCVIRGETYHFEIVANESSRGLMDLGTREGAVIGNGILTVENEAQAFERADPERQDKGGAAALAACIMLDLKERGRW